MRLLEVKSKIKSGRKKDLAIKSLKPPVFFKDIPEFGKHLDIWNEEDIYYFFKETVRMSSVKSKWCKIF